MVVRGGSARRVTVGRMVALLLVVAVAVGLLVLRLSGGGGAVSVPAGARAGQLLQLHPCRYPTEDGDRDAECGILVVPENRTTPQTRLIALPVTRLPGRAGHTGAPIFYLTGGPGGTNTVFPMASRFTPNHDVVLVGYRGVDGSTRLDCPEVTAALTGVDDLTSPATLRAYSAAYRTCARRLTAAGVDLLGYNSVERVDDFEAARRAFGYDTVNLISDSAGTRTAMLYAWRYPAAINRSVMLGADPPGHFADYGPTTDQLIDRYGQLCAADPSCRPRTGDLAATMRALSRDLPRRWGPFVIKSGNVKAVTFEGMYQATSEAVPAPFSAPYAIDAWLAAAHGDSSGLWLGSVLTELLYVSMPMVWGDAPATLQLDAEAARAYFAAGGDHGTILGNPNDLWWGGGGAIDAWPHAAEVDPYRTLRPSDVPTLLISGDLDVSTPATFATAMLPSLRHGDQVVLHNLGHVGDTWSYNKAGTTRLVNTFLDTGRVDTTAVTPRAMSFTASPTWAQLAKTVVAVLAGLAALTILAVVGLPLWQRRRGHLGRPTAVLTRAVLAPFVALGGWAVAVLLVFSIWPTVPILAPPLVVVAMTIPVAVVGYAAWADQAWTPVIRRIGLGAAAGGAAVGAWLGLHATSGLLSPLTAAIGATLGMNLALLLHDLYRPTPATAQPTHPAPIQPSTPRSR